MEEKEEKEKGRRGDVGRQHTEENIVVGSVRDRKGLRIHES